MPKYIRFHHLPWHSGSFIGIASLGFGFGGLTCLVLSAMAINGFLTQGLDYPKVVMAQEAIILTMAVLPTISCTCSYSRGDGQSDGRSSVFSQLPVLHMLFTLFAFIFRAATTGFYLKDQYSQCYNESKRNVYVLESSAALIILLLYFLCVPFSIGFYTPLFKKGRDYTVAQEGLNYTAKQYTFISILITVESWTENTVKDEESGDVPAAPAAPAATDPIPATATVNTTATTTAAAAAAATEPTT